MVKSGDVVCTDIVTRTGEAVNDLPLSAGDFFGERALLMSEPRAASVLATSDTVSVIGVGVLLGARVLTAATDCTGNVHGVGSKAVHRAAGQLARAARRSSCGASPKVHPCPVIADGQPARARRQSVQDDVVRCRRHTGDGGTPAVTRRAAMLAPCTRCSRANGLFREHPRTP